MFHKQVGDTGPLLWHESVVLQSRFHQQRRDRRSRVTGFGKIRDPSITPKEGQSAGNNPIKY